MEGGCGKEINYSEKNNTYSWLTTINDVYNSEHSVAQLIYVANDYNGYSTGAS